MFPDVKKVLNDEIIDTISSYYQSNFQILNVHIYRTFSIPKAILTNGSFEAYGSTEYWHNDGTTVESIKMFVLLNTVTEENGPLHVVSLADTKKIMKNGFRKKIEGKSNGVIEKTFKISKFTGEAGSVLLANTNTILHRADVPRAGLHRDMLVFYITSSRQPLTDDWADNAVKHQYLGLSRLLLK